MRLDRQLERIFRFLGIKYPPTDVDPILSTILKGKEEQRIHAIEFLDNILDSELKKELMPVAESILVEITSEENIKKLNLKVLSETECYTELLNRKDAKLKMAVLSLIEKTGDKKFDTILEYVKSNEPNEKIRLKAENIIQQFSTFP
jgi:AAA family ATP:ADP antiporter